MNLHLRKVLNPRHHPRAQAHLPITCCSQHHLRHLAGKNRRTVFPFLIVDFRFFLPFFPRFFSVYAPRARQGHGRFLSRPPCASY